jgi:barstar (barnase inhibitor)
MVSVTLDGGAISSEADLHRILASALDFGPYYGRKLDARCGTGSRAMSNDPSRSSGPTRHGAGSP